MLFVFCLYGPILLLTIITHELGHALTNKKLGGQTGDIVLWPLGGFAICGPTDSLIGDLKVALAGPLTHIPMSLLWWIVYVATKTSAMSLWPSWTIYLDVLSSGALGFFEMLSAQAVYLNLALLCFNLFIPAYPLDGGRIYAASLILVFKMGALKAAKVTAITGFFLGIGMILYALISTLMGAAGTQLLLGLIGVFVFYQSYELWAQKNDLSNHPIFGRQCYNQGSNTSSAATTEPGAVPAETDEAVMA